MHNPSNSLPRYSGIMTLIFLTPWWLPSLLNPFLATFGFITEFEVWAVTPLRIFLTGLIISIAVLLGTYTEYRLFGKKYSFYSIKDRSRLITYGVVGFVYLYLAILFALTASFEVVIGSFITAAFLILVIYFITGVFGKDDLDIFDPTLQTSTEN